jgi:ferredoxin-type protein NapH
VTLFAIRPWRRLVQAGVLLAFIGIPFLNKAEYNALSGNFLAFNFAGVPLGDPLAALQVMTGALSATAPMLVGAGLALLLAALMGPVFCSWLCPFGFLSELAHRNKGCALPARGRPALSPRPFAARAAIVAAGLAAIPLFVPTPALNQLSMPGWYSRAMQHAVLYHEVLWGGVILIAAVLAAELVSGKRFWCRWVCPQSVLIGLAGLPLPARFRVRFNRSACTCAADDRACLAACHLCLNPRLTNAPQRAQCANCGDCVDACSGRGKALSMGFGKQIQCLRRPGRCPGPRRGK